MQSSFNRNDWQSWSALGGPLVERSLRVSGESRLDRMAKILARSSSSHSSVYSGSGDSPACQHIHPEVTPSDCWVPQTGSPEFALPEPDAGQLREL